MVGSFKIYQLFPWFFGRDARNMNQNQVVSDLRTTRKLAFFKRALLRRCAFQDGTQNSHVVTRDFLASLSRPSEVLI